MWQGNDNIYQCLTSKVGKFYDDYFQPELFFYNRCVNISCVIH